MQRNSPTYILVFIVLLCLGCSIVVSSAVVLLGDRQRAYANMSRMQEILTVAGRASPDEELEPMEVMARFSSIRALAVRLDSGEIDPSIDAMNFDQREASRDPDTSREAPANPANVRRLPHHAVVFEVLDAKGELESIVLPIHGQGFNDEMYGFISLGPDLNTVTNIVFYEHVETPGLGARIDDPDWRAGWTGRRVYGDDGEVAIELVAGPVGSPSSAPHQVDALTGATMTSNGVANILRFWLGDDGFAPLLRSREPVMVSAVITRQVADRSCGLGSTGGCIDDVGRR